MIEDTEFDSPETLKLRISTLLNIPSGYLEIVSPEKVTSSDEEDFTKIHTSICTDIETRFSGKITYTTYSKHIEYLMEKELSLCEIYGYITIDFRDFVIFSLSIIDLSEDILKEFNEIVNDYFPEDLRESVKFKGLLDLQGFYESYSNQEYIGGLIKKDANLLERLTHMQTDLVKIEKPQSTVLSASGKTYKISISKTDGSKIRESDAVDIFDDSKVSNFIPYIQYNGPPIDENKKHPYEKYYKIYDDAKISSLRKGSVTFKLSNCIYVLIIYKGKQYHVDIFFEENSYAVISLKKDIDIVDIIRSISEHVPVKFGSMKEVNVSAEFEMYNLQVFETSFVHMVTANDLFSNYIYVNEIDEPVSRKQRLKFHFKDLSSSGNEEETSGLSFSITQLFVKPEGLILENVEDVFKYEDVVEKEIHFEGSKPTIYNMKTGTPYILISVTRSLDFEMLQKFMKIITRLIMLYSKEYKSIENLYSQYLAGYSSRWIEQKTKLKTLMNIRESGKTRSSDLTELQKGAPDLFIDKFATNCNSDRRPEIMPAQNLQKWMSENPTLTGRQVMLYPKETQKFAVICTNETFIYPGVKKNKLINKDKYSHLPCCYKEDQTVIGKKTGFNEYYRDQKFDIAEKSQTYKLKPGSILDPGRVAYAPDKIQQIMKIIYPNINTDSIKVMGVYKSLNSLLHCLCFATMDIGYYHAIDKESYIKDVRMKLATADMACITKQEMYNYSIEEIIDQIADMKLFFDSGKFYRIVEEAFNVNTFIFTINKRKEGKQLISTIEMEIPRHKYFHIPSRNQKRGRNVILLKHSGTKGKYTEYPQYELLTIESEGGDIYLYDNSVYDKCNKIYEISSEVYTSVFESLTDDKGNEVIDVTTREKLYNSDDLFQSLSEKGIEVTHQYIDKYGKVRSIMLNGSIIMHILPTYPRILPFFDEDKIEKPEYDELIELFGAPTYREMNMGKVVGLWFRLYDMYDGIYCPTKESELDEHLSEITPSKKVIHSNAENSITRIKKIQKIIDRLIQLYKWVMIVHKKQNGTFEQFMNFFMIVEFPENFDSTKIYDVSSLRKDLPIVSDAIEAIRWIETSTTGIVKNGKFIMYSKKFYDGVKYSLKRFNADIDGVNVSVPTRFANYYRDVSDFKKGRDTTVIIGSDELVNWINYKLDNSNYNNIGIHYYIDMSYAIKMRPYIYISSEEDRSNMPLSFIYIIQNVKGGNKNRAINVALKWYTDSKNIGYNSSLYKSELNKDTVTMREIHIPKHIIYSLSPGSTPILTEDNSKKSERYIELLNYGGGVYAAMLPIV